MTTQIILGQCIGILLLFYWNYQDKKKAKKVMEVQDRIIKGLNERLELQEELINLYEKKIYDGK